MANLPSDTLVIDTAESVDTVPIVTLGFAFTLTQRVTFMDVRFYSPEAQDHVQAFLWNGVGTVLASSPEMSVSQGWNLLQLSSPITVDPGGYVVAVRIDPDGFTATAAYYTSTAGLPSGTFGPITTDAAPGRYSYSNWNGSPPANSSSRWYGVDLVTQDAAPTYQWFINRGGVATPLTFHLNDGGIHAALPFVLPSEIG